MTALISKVGNCMCDSFFSSPDRPAEKRGRGDRKERPVVISGEINNRPHQTGNTMYRKTNWKKYNETLGHKILNSNNDQTSNYEYDPFENYNENDDDDGNVNKYDESYNDDYGDGSQHVENTESKNVEQEEANVKFHYEGEESGEEKPNTKYNSGDITEGETTGYNADGFTGGLQHTSMPFNVTLDSSLMFYNRVPKCASSTIQTILRR